MTELAASNVSTAHETIDERSIEEEERKVLSKARAARMNEGKI